MFALKCSDTETHQVYIDSYHCADVDPLVAVGGLHPYYHYSAIPVPTPPLQKPVPGEMLLWAGMQLVKVPKGSFKWSDYDDRSAGGNVTLTRDIEVSSTEVTTGLYSAVMNPEGPAPDS